MTHGPVTAINWTGISVQLRSQSSLTWP